MHKTPMCSFQDSRLFIPVNTTNFIPHHQSHSYRIALHDKIQGSRREQRCPSALSSTLIRHSDFQRAMKLPLQSSRAVAHCGRSSSNGDI